MCLPAISTTRQRTGVPVALFTTAPPLVCGAIEFRSLVETMTEAIQ